MGQEFVIKSQNLEDRINQLLPSQGGAQAGVDLSASSMIVPIIDLTESAEGSNLRQDLQRALSLTACTTFEVVNSTSTIINTTGYFRIFGTFVALSSGTVNAGSFSITDGTTTKKLLNFATFVNSGNPININKIYDFIVFLEAGDSVTVTSGSTTVNMGGTTRQIADINGNLVNP